MRRLILTLVAVVVLISTTAAGCGGNTPAEPDKFTRDCTVRGGHVSTQRHGHGIRRVCLPPPGGWQ